MSTGDSASKRSNPRLESKPQKAKFSNMSPLIFGNHIKKDNHEENKNLKNSILKTPKKTKFCSYQFRTLKNKSQTRCHSHINSPEKYFFVTKKFPTVDK